MIQLVLGLGKIGVQIGMDPGMCPKLYLGTLKEKCEPGESYEDNNLQQQEVLLTFTTEEGLDVLIDALSLCKERGFNKVPDELRMGA